MAVHHIDVDEIGAGLLDRASTSSPRREKSAERIDGAMRMEAMAGLRPDSQERPQGGSTSIHRQ